MKNWIIFLTLVCLCLPLTSQSQTENNRFGDSKSLKKVGQAGYTFLKIGMDARNTALGEAGVTLEGDASTIFFNPAGITSIEGQSVFAGHTAWIADIGKSALAYAVNLKQWGIIGVSALYMDYNTIEGTEIDPFSPVGYTDIGNIDVQEYAIGLTYGYRFTDKFGLAVTAKYCYQDLYAVWSDKVAFDVGTIYDIGWNGMKVGMSIQHFSTNEKYVAESFQLPLTFHIGGSLDLLDVVNIESTRHDLDFLFEGNNPIDYSERFHLGLEYWYNEFVALRAGYKINYDEEGLTLGAGVNYRGMHVGYSYTSMGTYLGAANRLSLNYSF